MTASRSFDQSNAEYIDSDDAAPTEGWPEASWSMSMWLKVTDGRQASSQWIFGLLNTGVTQVIQAWVTAVDGEIGFYMEIDNIGAVGVTDDPIFPDGQSEWVHIAFRLDWTADQMDIFVNGAKEVLRTGYGDGDTSGLTAANWASPAGTIHLGVKNHVGVDPYFEPLGCEMADVRRYNRALTDSEILELYSGKVNTVVADGFHELVFGDIVDYRGNLSPTNGTTTHATSASNDGPPVWIG